MSATTTPVSTHYRWQVKPRDYDAEAILRKELGVSSLAATLLVRRGLSDPTVAEKFIRPSLGDLHDPRGLPDYDAARNAILGAKERGELIFVHGDYDVDGVTSAAIFDRFLNSVGANVHTHVPHRMKEGYGIHLRAVAAAKEAGAKVFLTCDCGVSAHEQVEAAKEAGMQVVVTDHHHIGSTLPGAVAVMNPHRADSDYPFHELSGAGVVFKFCAGLTRDLGHDPEKSYYRGFLDLAALGTIADVVPLIGENRIIAKFGLERLADTKKVGLQALMRGANMEVGKAVTARNVGFQIGPRLNAAGRIDDAALSLRLLLSRDAEEARAIAEELEAINSSRRSEQQKITQHAIELVQAQGIANRNVILIGDRSWHPGIIGLVASRLVEQFRRPAFVAAIDPDSGVWKSSARSIAGFHLADAIHAHPDLFLGGGGHAMAAGCSFEDGKFDAIAAALDAYGAKVLNPEDFIPAISADAEVDLAEITINALEELEMLAPFGQSNPEPFFIARKSRFSQITPTRTGEHVRVTVRDAGGTVLGGMGFSMGERLGTQAVGSRADILFQANINEFNGSRNAQLILKDYVLLEE